LFVIVKGISAGAGPLSSLCQLLDIIYQDFGKSQPEIFGFFGVGVNVSGRYQRGLYGVLGRSWGCLDGVEEVRKLKKAVDGWVFGW